MTEKKKTINMSTMYEVLEKFVTRILKINPIFQPWTRPNLNYIGFFSLKARKIIYYLTRKRVMRRIDEEKLSRLEKFINDNAQNNREQLKEIILKIMNLSEMCIESVHDHLLSIEARSRAVILLGLNQLIDEYGADINEIWRNIETRAYFRSLNSKVLLGEESVY